ncbi:MAG: hypothetical protein H3Z54_10335, partial [archaeon]|nr:hypothetical protein [archaeon]
LGVIDRNGTVCFDVESWMLDYYDDQKVQIIAGEGEDLYILGVELYIFTGSYEWITAGRDSHPVDSLGASMVTEAFDSIKNIPVMMPSLDVKEPLTPTVPFLLRKFGTGDTRADYYYSTTDKRLALKDDWSSTVPIASSNIITVGGPLSNAVTEYFNEFEEAVYRGLYGYNDFLLVPDWGSTFLGPDREWALDTTIPGVVEDDLGKAGIGIISTYKDINGTVGFVVYGYSGEDTLWTSTLLFQWNIPIFLDDGNGVLDWTDDNENGIMDPEDFTYDIKWIPKLGWCEGMWAEDDLMLGWIYYDSWGNPKWMFYPLIYWLQEENPGVVELVIKIYYEIPNTDNPYAIDEEELFSTDTHPVALIVEELGTISEKPQHPDP